MKRYFLLSVFTFISVYSMAQILGAEHLISQGIHPIDVSKADLDGDGDLDVISGGMLGQLFWYENVKNGKFSSKKIIAEVPLSISTINATDLDGDGDFDLLMLQVSSSEDDIVQWYENDGAGNFGTGNVIIQDDLLGMCPGDMDGDGDVDIVMHFEKKGIVWIANGGMGNFSTENSITGSYSKEVQCKLFVEDLNGDGDQDVICGAYAFSNEEALAWFENLGNGSFNASSYHTLNSPAYLPTSLTLLDVDGDNDLDVLTLEGAFANDLGLRCFENKGGGNYDTTWKIPVLAKVPFRLKVADVDGDADDDLIISTQSSGLFLENQGGSFSTPVKLTNAFRPQFTYGDFDGDKKVDVFFTSVYRSGWYKKLGMGFASERLIEDHQTAPTAICFTDLDNDGKRDLVAATDSQLYWKRHLGNGKFGTANVFGDDQINFPADFHIASADLNGDLKMDIILSSSTYKKIIWFKNLGNGKFDTSKKIGDVDSREMVYTRIGDIDSDGDLDIVFMGLYEGIQWYENQGAGNFGPKITISTEQHLFPEIVDLDGDGDLDIVSEIHSYTEPSYGYRWYRNDGGGNFTSTQTKHLGGIKSEKTERVIPMDIDGDADIDLLELVRFAGNDGMYLHENLGNGIFKAPELSLFDDVPIASRELILTANDIDGDGDLDLVQMSQSGDVILWTNTGDNSFERSWLLLDLNDVSNGLILEDIDLDGDADFVCLPERAKFFWIENLFGSAYKLGGHIFYDANENGIYDTGERGLRFAKAKVQPTQQAGYTNANGEYSFSVSQSTHTVSYESGLNWKLTSDSSTYTKTPNTVTPVINNLDFGFKQKVTQSHLLPRLNSGIPRCNRSVSFWVSVQNVGSSIPSGIVHLQLDDSLVLDSSVVTPDSVNGQNLYWHFDDLFFSEYEVFRVFATMPPVRDSTNKLESFVTVYETDGSGNIVSSKKTSRKQQVVCAFDPNDKNVSPKGVGPLGLIEPNQELTYLVRFQNTGNDTAFTVLIRDELDTNLDWSTLRPLASSHPMEVRVENDGEVEFKFKDILLPDSNVNELESHGFVEYSIMPKKELPPLAKMCSPAAIYFDFNKPVVTNSVLNTVLCYSAPQPKITLNFPRLESGVTGDYQFQWYFNGEMLENETSRTITPQKEGAYTVEVTDTNTCNKVSEPYNYVIDDLDELQEMKTSIYPNPFSSKAIVQFDRDLDGAYDLKVVNIIGSDVASFNNIKGNQVMLSKTDLGKGMFLCYLVNHTTGGRVLIDKILVN